MTGIEPRPFEGFTISRSTSRFEVVGHDFRLARRWWSGELSSNGKSEFSTAVHGETTGDEVCEFETGSCSKIFSLTVTGDSNIKESWESIRRMESFTDTLTDQEQRRIRQIQHEIFDKSPPTAALFRSGGWSLECEIPLPVLEHLTADLVAGS